MANPHAAEDGIYLAQVLAQLAKLGEGMKETALLVHAEGMSHAEAGAVLGVSESTISWRVHTIRKHMGKPAKPVRAWPMNEKSVEANCSRKLARRAPDPAARLLEAKRAALEEFARVHAANQACREASEAGFQRFVGRATSLP